MPTYTYHCPDCEYVTDGFFKLSETRPDRIPCFSCGSDAEYTLAAPMVLKASYLDGQRSGKWKQLKEASKLNTAAARTDDLAEKKALDAEVKKTGYSFKENQ